MSYEENIGNIPPNFNGGQEFAINGLGQILFSQIFNGVPQLYPGSSFTVEEVIEFGIIITIPEVIDTDFRWYPPKRYLGTWTIFDQVSAFGTYPEDRGFIEDTITKVRRYSTYVVQANADVPVAEFESGAIDNCNFLLKEVGIEIPPFAGSINTLAVNDSVFKFRNTLQKVPLIDQPFNARIKTIGLHIDSGAELTFINYKCRIINAISVDLPPFPLTVCTTAAGSCEVLFEQYLATLNTNTAVVQFYSTQGEALAAQTADGNSNSTIFVVSQYTSYTCPVEPFNVYEIWSYQRTIPN
jgi:hypothetical protein